jgi:hypothetical protein
LLHVRGVRRKKSEAEQENAMEQDELVQLMIAQDRSALSIFNAVYGRGEGQGVMQDWLSGGGIPGEVLAFCRQELAHQKRVREAQHRFKLEAVYG